MAGYDPSLLWRKTYPPNGSTIVLTPVVTCMVVPLVFILHLDGCPILTTLEDAASHVGQCLWQILCQPNIQSSVPLGTRTRYNMPMCFILYTSHSVHRYCMMNTVIIALGFGQCFWRQGSIYTHTLINPGTQPECNDHHTGRGDTRWCWTLKAKTTLLTKKWGMG